jgi:hypothetical protein
VFVLFSDGIDAFNPQNAGGLARRGLIYNICGLTVLRR